MKNILLFALVLMSFFLNAQTKKTAQKKAIETNEQKVLSEAKAYFEKEYVQKNFKDPYSYELKKIWSEPMSQEKVLSDSINYYYFKALDIDKNILSRFGGAKSERIDETTAKSKLKENQNRLEAQLQEMSDLSKKSIVAYKVFFDTYGANSYGNKILGKYYVKYLKDGERLGDVEQRKD